MVHRWHSQTHLGLLQLNLTMMATRAHSPLHLQDTSLLLSDRTCWKREKEPVLQTLVGALCRPHHDHLQTSYQLERRFLSCWRLLWLAFFFLLVVTLPLTDAKAKHIILNSKDIFFVKMKICLIIYTFYVNYQENVSFVGLPTHCEVLGNHSQRDKHSVTPGKVKGTERV